MKLLGFHLDYIMRSLTVAMLKFMDILLVLREICILSVCYHADTFSLLHFANLSFLFCIQTKISFSLNVAFTALGTLPSLCPFLFFAARLELLIHDI